MPEGGFSSENCTDAQEDERSASYREIYLDVCNYDPCASECVDAISKLYMEYPDCVNSVYYNWSRQMAAWLEVCGLFSSDSGSDAGYSSATCTEDEENEAHDVAVTYETGACETPTTCTDDCLSELYNFSAYTPNCVSSEDDMNYLYAYDSWISYCEVGEVGSASEASESDIGTEERKSLDAPIWAKTFGGWRK